MMLQCIMSVLDDVSTNIVMLSAKTIINIYIKDITVCNLTEGQRLHRIMMDALCIESPQNCGA